MTTPGWPSSLGQLTMFAECSPAELRAVASLVTGVRVPAGHVLMREGAAGREALFIVDGTARVVRQDQEVATLGRGDVVGEMALSGDGLRSATVTALTPVTAYVCTPSEFAGVRVVAPSVDRMITTTEEKRTHANRVSRRRRDGFRRGRRRLGNTGLWRAVELPGRGTTYAVDLAGPSPQADTVVLLHGLMMTGTLNWEPSLSVLNERYRVVALDQRGHGSGITTGRAFTLEDCADDAIALMDVLGIDRAMFAGYSMGGPIAQLVWRRHPGRVTGLVLCATAANFRGTTTERLVGSTMPDMDYAFGFFPSRVWAVALRSVLARVPAASSRQAALVGALSHHDDAAIHQASRTIREFDSTDWIGGVSVPAVVMLTARDRLVPPARQLELAKLITGAELVRLDAGHLACCTQPEEFTVALRQACDQIARRLPSVTARTPARRAPTSV